MDYGAQRPELRHAGPKDVNREAELDRPSRVACSDLLAVLFCNWLSCLWVKKSNRLMDASLIQKNQRCKDITEEIGAESPRAINLPKPLTGSEAWLPLLEV
jgi:hypothetical protein